MRYKVFHPDNHKVPYHETKVQYVIGDAVEYEHAARSITMTSKFETIIHKQIGIRAIKTDDGNLKVYYSLWEMTTH